MPSKSRPGTHCLQPEDDSGGDADGGHEGMRATVVTGVDTPPVLEPADHGLDFVTLTVERAIIVEINFTIGFGRDARRYA